MAAVVRVKRHLDEEPLEAIVLNCKRRKLCEDTTEDNVEKPELSKVLKFAGTIKKDEDVFTHLKNQRIPEIHELKELFKKHPVSVKEKLRTEKQESSKNSRYKIVNCFRSISAEESTSQGSKEKESLDTEYTVYDIETDLNDNNPVTENKNPEYVYDLYYTNSDDFGDSEIEEYVSIYPLNDPLIAGSFRDHGLSETDDEYISEDSNAEDNWRNDYPDEEEMGLDEDIMEGMNNCYTGELSSEDEFDKICETYYDEFPNKDEFEDDVDLTDVYQFGEGYAKFKAKHTKAEDTSDMLYYGDIDENEYYY